MTAERPRRDSWLWSATIAIWCLGLLPLYGLWYAHPFENNIAENLFELGVFLVACWYFLALGPIRSFLERFFDVDRVS